MPDSALVDDALAALLARHRAAEVDAAYASYDDHPLDEDDGWGDQIVEATGRGQGPWSGEPCSSLRLRVEPVAFQHIGGDAPRAKPVSLTSAVLILAAAGLLALALYRLLARTSGLDLGTGWATVGIAFGVTAAAVLALPALVRPLRRRWRWMRAADDVSRAHAAWRDFHDDLADFGIRSRPSEPPRTLAGRLAATLPPAAAEAVRRLALAEERASYSARPAPSSDLRRDGSRARRGLAETARRGTRLRAFIFPLSLLSAVSDGAGRLASLRPSPRPAASRRRRLSGSH
jgi:hypothetical protein